MAAAAPGGWRQEVATLPLAAGVRAQLLGLGFSHAADLRALTAAELAQQASISVEDAQEALRAARGWHADAWDIPAAVRASELLQADEERIQTLSRELDQVLLGGVPCGRVLEFCGVPGVGKTQLGMQLAVNVQIPKLLSGVGGAAVYIDTEGGLQPERLAEVASATARRVAKSLRRNDGAADPEAVAARQRQAEAFTTDQILSNIHVFRVHDSAEQLACVHGLDAFVDQHPEVRLVVVDSVTFHFRQETRDAGARARTLTGMAQALMRLAERRNLAVVLVNQVTTRINAGAGAQLLPALGESWAQAVSVRVLLLWDGSERRAHLYKAPGLPPASGAYLIGADGVRGMSVRAASGAAAVLG